MYGNFSYSDTYRWFSPYFGDDWVQTYNVAWTLLVGPKTVKRARHCLALVW
jgi:hypothetical protein